MKIKVNRFFSLFLTAAFLLSSSSLTLAVRPDEGMYTPDQIAKLPLRARGLRIRPIDIYNPNGVGLSDAIMRVNIGEGGGFGTGEFVSPNGLILTNHHVGFDALVAASTPQQDYAKKGYRASSQSAELPAKGYSLLLTNRVVDVTSQVVKGTESLSGDVRRATITENIKDLQAAEQAKAGADRTIRIQELNSGLFYYLYDTSMIRDVRVVYAPPQSIGFFGGDPDNFEWTRHTGDFTFLRAYVGPDGKPAEYSPNNVPFKPKKFLTVSLGGIRENDFVFVLGYPGGTTRYRERQAIAYAENVSYPFIVAYLQAWADALNKIGENDEEKRIKLQSEIFSLNNSIKAYDGGVVAIKRAHVVDDRNTQEAKFINWANADPRRKQKYGDLLSRIAAASAEYYRTGTSDRILRSFPRPDITPIYKQIYDAVVAVRNKQALTGEKRNEIEAAFKDREPLIETEMLKFFLRALAQVPAGQKFNAVESIFAGKQGRERRMAEQSFAESITMNKDLDEPADIIRMYDLSFDELKAKYPAAVTFAAAHADERAAISKRTMKFNADIEPLRLLYQEGMSEMTGKSIYPDANATLRFTFGNVKGYMPREAVIYEPFTTLKGVLEKDIDKDPFDAPDQLHMLQTSHDFGRYGLGDSVPVNFLATTDIIGGNSGSPILNGNGEQVGIAFDSNYEGLGNDIFFSPDYGRTIAVDIRYVLFITEKFGKAGWILNEMKIVGRPAARRASAR